jgi:hypothetical protein
VCPSINQIEIYHILIEGGKYTWKWTCSTHGLYVFWKETHAPKFARFFIEISISAKYGNFIISSYSTEQYLDTLFNLLISASLHTSLLLYVTYIRYRPCTCKYMYVCLFWAPRAIFQHPGGDHQHRWQDYKFRPICLALMAPSKEGSVTCHTYCDTRPPLL